jgi:hypothetical protein
MRRASGESIRYLPAHPHEGSVGVPETLEAVAFVTEPQGDGVLQSPDRLDDTHRYVENIAAWLAGRA